MIHLVRWADTPHGIFGTLRVGSFECYTVERNWEENRPFVSCIPEGTYGLRLTKYSRGGYSTVELKDVPGRSRILMHKGNLSTDVQGCIATGTRLGVLDGKWAVLASAHAFQNFWQEIYFSNEHAGVLTHKRIQIVWRRKGQPGRGVVL